MPQPPLPPAPVADTAAMSSMGLQPQRVQSLLLQPQQHPRGCAHLSAASGLVRVGARLYVVADDELHLGMFDDAPLHGEAAFTPQPGQLLRLMGGELPAGKAARKALKPDLETLALLPPLPGCPAGALLALGSGSAPQRQRGMLLALSGQGQPNGRVAPVDLAALYAPLRRQFADLNIEGALVVSGELLLLQRGNRGDARSACIRFDWNQMAPWLAGTRPQPPVAKSVQVLALGSVQGVPMGLTDGTPLQGGAWMFSAVAEDTGHSVQDGVCVGSAIGIVSPGGQIEQMVPLTGAPKVEGIAAQAQGNGWRVSLVTDPDDPAQASELLELVLGSEI